MILDANDRAVTPMTFSRRQFRHHLIRLIAIALLSLILTFHCAAAFAQDTVGQVTDITGSAKLERGGIEVEAATMMPIKVRDKLRTTAKSKVTVTFRDGSKLVLSESSSYTIDEYSIGATNRMRASIALWAGHLRAIVFIAAGGVPDFEVHTPNASAAVRGTEFETAIIADRPQAAQVSEGYETTVACEAPATSPAPLGM